MEFKKKKGQLFLESRTSKIYRPTSRSILHSPWPDQNLTQDRKI